MNAEERGILQSSAVLHGPMIFPPNGPILKILLLSMESQEGRGGPKQKMQESVDRSLNMGEPLDLQSCPAIQ